MANHANNIKYTSNNSYYHFQIQKIIVPVLTLYLLRTFIISHSENMHFQCLYPAARRAGPFSDWFLVVNFNSVLNTFFSILE